jgi:hypothetical protein
MGTIENRFYWVMMWFALLIVHILFINLDVNVYREMFWPSAIAFVLIIIFAVIAFSRMETLMKSVGTKVLIAKYKKILGSFSFWGLFLVFTLLLYIDAYALGQFFLPADQATKLFLPDLNEWFIYLPFSIAATIAIVHFLKATITAQVGE